MGKMQVRRVAAALAAVALAFVAGGCGAVDGAGARRVGLPAAFPADVPLPEAAVVRTARDLGKKGLNVVFEVHQAPLEAAAGFEARMRAAGWTVAGGAVLEGAVFTSFRSGERSLAVGVSAAAGVTLMSVSVVERPYNEWEEGA